MARRSRPRAIEEGQRHSVPLRSRDLSGIRSRGNSPLVYARHFVDLWSLIESIGAPCWAFGLTAGALSGFDEFPFEPPFHVVVPHDRSVTRLGHVVHRCRDISRLDITEVDGLPTISATRTIIDLAATESPERLAVAIDSALRDRLTSEDFLYRRIVELRRRGRPELDKLVAVLEGHEISTGGQSWLERRFLVLLAEPVCRGHRLSRLSAGARSA